MKATIVCIMKNKNDPNKFVVQDVRDGKIGFLENLYDGKNGFMEQYITKTQAKYDSLKEWQLWHCLIYPTSNGKAFTCALEKPYKHGDCIDHVVNIGHNIRLYDFGLILQVNYYPASLGVYKEGLIPSSGGSCKNDGCGDGEPYVPEHWGTICVSPGTSSDHSVKALTPDLKIITFNNYSFEMREIPYDILVQYSTAEPLYDLTSIYSVEYLNIKTNKIKVTYNAELEPLLRLLNPEYKKLLPQILLAQAIKQAQDTVNFKRELKEKEHQAYLERVARREEYQKHKYERNLKKGIREVSKGIKVVAKGVAAAAILYKIFK